MIRRLCTICARGGSKGVKNKNVRELLGKPLIAHTIERAKACKLFECIAVSSDSEQILDIAKAWGADYVIQRPKTMASDTAAKLPAIQHCAKEAERLSGKAFDTFVDLDATSPLRSIEDIHGAVQLLEEQKGSNVITGAPSRRSPYFNLVEVDSKGSVKLSKPLPSVVVRRQDAPLCYDMNASIYVWKRNSFFESKQILLEDTMLYAMPEERSIDIDSELDFKWVEFLMKEHTS